MHTTKVITQPSHCSFYSMCCCFFHCWIMKLPRAPCKRGCKEHLHQRIHVPRWRVFSPQQWCLVSCSPAQHTEWCASYMNNLHGLICDSSAEILTPCLLFIALYLHSCISRNIICSYKHRFLFTFIKQVYISYKSKKTLQTSQETRALWSGVVLWRTLCTQKPSVCWCWLHPWQSQGQSGSDSFLLIIILSRLIMMTSGLAPWIQLVPQKAWLSHVSSCSLRCALAFVYESKRLLIPRDF